MEQLVFNAVAGGMQGIGWVANALNHLVGRHDALAKKVAAIAMLAFLAYSAFTSFALGAMIGAFAVMQKHWSSQQTLRIWEAIEGLLSPNVGLAFAVASLFFPQPFALTAGAMLGSVTVGLADTLQT